MLSVAHACLSFSLPAAAALSSRGLPRALMDVSHDRRLYQHRQDSLAKRKQGLLDSADERVLLEIREALPSHWQRVISVLSPFMKERRVIRLQAALRKRRSRLHLVLENIVDPHNCAAVLRAAEACGVQHVHVIESVSEFQLPVPTSRTECNSGNNEAQDAVRWVSLHKYRSSSDCIKRLDELGLQVCVVVACEPPVRARGRLPRPQVFASDCPTDDSDDDVGPNAVASEGRGWNTAKRHTVSAVPIAELDFSSCPAGSALVFGNERRGVSRLMLERCARSFYLPMSGHTQSFNISVAVVMSLYSAIASGAFPEGDLTPDQQDEILGSWMMRDVKASRALLMDAGIEFMDF